MYRKKRLCLQGETSCPPAENINEIPAKYHNPSALKKGCLFYIVFESIKVSRLGIGAKYNKTLLYGPHFLAQGMKKIYQSFY